MAGAGYKLFVNGNTLSASDLNTYLNQQSIMVFATTGARDSALTGVLSEGMHCYIIGTGRQYYNGTSWITDITATSTSTLTNKTLTAPAISGTVSGTTTIQGASAASGTLTLPATTDTLVGRATTDTLSNKTMTAPAISGTVSGTTTLQGASAASGTLTLPATTDTLVALSTTDTLANKTLTSPKENNPYITSPKELTTVSATAATGTIQFDALTQGVLYYTTSASGNFTLNIRGNSGTTLNSIMNNNDAWSIVFLNTNGATPYYLTAITIDGNAQTIKWTGGTAPTAGNASAIDAYSFIIVKTASATFTVLGSQVKFA